MEFCRVDRAAWPRNEYFEHYFSNTPCTYSMTVKLDVTNIEEKGLKYYPALLYALTTVVNRHEEFRTALDAEGQVGIFSELYRIQQGDRNLLQFVDRIYPRLPRVLRPVAGGFAPLRGQGGNDAETQPPGEYLPGVHAALGHL